MRAAAVLLLLLPQVAAADSVVAARTVRAQQIVGPDDVTMAAKDIPGALSNPAAAYGLEARTTLYAGRAVKAADLGLPAVVERNQTVPISFHAGGLVIQAEGRALARGGAGDVIRVLNLGSRTTVSGRITPDGQVVVGPNP